jgi:uncharacterized membrane protein YdbT with pleckstrin-like domain
MLGGVVMGANDPQSATKKLFKMTWCQGVSMALAVLLTITLITLAAVYNDPGEVAIVFLEASGCVLVIMILFLVRRCEYICW